MTASSAEAGSAEKCNGVEKLHNAIARGKQTSGVALMSHCVVGYPRLQDNEGQVRALVEAGADLMELQFPFSDPLADGPILTAANQQAVNQGTRVRDCMEIARAVCASHPQTAFIVMTYFNIAHRMGLSAFATQLADAGIAGAIIPDLPPELSDEWNRAADAVGIGTVYLVTPNASQERVTQVAKIATGFVYCIGRPGVSGSSTAFNAEMIRFVNRVRDAASVPVGVGFGVRTKSDVESVGQMADMAIICTEMIRRIDADGIESAANYLASLR